MKIIKGIAWLLIVCFWETFGILLILVIVIVGCNLQPKYEKMRVEEYGRTDIEYWTDPRTGVEYIIRHNGGITRRWHE